MKVIKRFKLLIYGSDDVNNRKITKLVSSTSSQFTLFDSEEEAVKEAFRLNKYEDWVILPIISFDNY